MFARIATFVLLACGFLTACGPDPSTGYRESDTHFRVVRESLYNQISVERTGDEVEMQFRVGRKSTRQTAVDLSNPLRLVIPYSRFMLAAALVEPHPENVLLIGLGGGGLNRFLRQAYPESRLSTVELDPVVVDLAREHMGFLPDDQDQVHIEDGRAFLKSNFSRWNWIFVDAYRDSSVPPHLKTQEFYKLLSDHLAPGGVVAFNLHSGSRLLASDLATLRSVFREVHLFGVSGTGNVIALAFDNPPPAFPKVELAAVVRNSRRPDILMEHLQSVLREYGGKAGPTSAPVLTDDFAPAEFLQQQVPEESPQGRFDPGVFYQKPPNKVMGEQVVIKWG